jgi:hypothetical protein
LVFWEWRTRRRRAGTLTIETVTNSQGKKRRSKATVIVGPGREGLCRDWKAAREITS